MFGKIAQRVLFIFLLVLSVSGCSVSWSPLYQPSQTQTEFKERQLISAQVAQKQLLLEVVTQPSSITQGLSGRDALGSDGMLFVLPKRQVPQFWMKDMKFDLDLVWLRDYRVTQVTALVPRPNSGVGLESLPLYSPSDPVDMVLELEAGKAAEWGISTGARLQVK